MTFDGFAFDVVILDWLKPPPNFVLVMTSRPPILPPALGLSMMLAIFSLHFLKPIAIWLPYPANYLGLVPLTIGVLVHLLAERELRVKGVVNANGEYNPNCPILVTSGVYQFSRNPSHLGVILIGCGLALWVGSVSPWLVVILATLILNLFYIHAEEAELKYRFGSRYERYCQIVPRWIGRPHCRR
jgi:protein-S-isoprenylcysteine O-methyltransferase Ste14